ncbi:hypothetical protein AMAG_02577 [Allomyces macrogynus ATCC 38327]|uniref:Basal body-orientation factor 1 n=1 Tax=Allomyces macrogynus (strain ATCC 38327) TaxID=578462 RepID=A0A0L0S320_ALLM3|nr:hypothetical protein AMAG_02577 [Allomyces macrogynus ATCC 38327]|eukprot:KNE56801.1 hypothetical protein AMAG_02577 [Allomyces macrogynus ATCC 38327]
MATRAAAKPAKPPATRASASTVPAAASITKSAPLSSTPPSADASSRPARGAAAAAAAAAAAGSRRRSVVSPAPRASQTSGAAGASTTNPVLGSRNALATTPASAGERALEVTLETTSKALAMYKERLGNLIQVNSELQNQCQEQEKDAIEVMGALRDEVEKKDREIIALRTALDQHRLASEQQAKDIHASYARRTEDLNSIITEKEAVIKIMEQEVAAVKDFKRKRAELMKEVESQKTQMAEMERRFKESMVRMERKFFEEKVRLQKETHRKIADLAAKAHREALATLDETTKDMCRENVRLAEALKAHMAATEDLTRANAKLGAQNAHLAQEKDMNDVIVRDKIIAAKNQNQVIKDLEGKVVTLEQTLSHVVREFEVERAILRSTAREELDEVKRLAAQLKLNLDRKTQEMRYIKKLANHILEQRTDVETFFMDALDHVRQEIARAQTQERKRRVQEYSQHLRAHHSGVHGGMVAVPPVSLDTAVQHARQPRNASPAGSVASSSTRSLSRHRRGHTRDEPVDAGPTPVIDVASLSWEDRERVLRVLFARMNGLLKDEKPAESHASTETPSSRASLLADVRRRARRASRSRSRGRVRQRTADSDGYHDESIVDTGGRTSVDSVAFASHPGPYGLGAVEPASVPPPSTPLFEEGPASDEVGAADAKDDCAVLPAVVGHEPPVSTPPLVVPMIVEPEICVTTSSSSSNPPLNPPVLPEIEVSEHMG